MIKEKIMEVYGDIKRTDINQSQQQLNLNPKDYPKISTIQGGILLA